jgi:hypothetical protein
VRAGPAVRLKFVIAATVVTYCVSYRDYAISDLNGMIDARVD